MPDGGSLTLDRLLPHQEAVDARFWVAVEVTAEYMQVNHVGSGFNPVADCNDLFFTRRDALVV